jgi:hypothetical protein
MEDSFESFEPVTMTKMVDMGNGRKIPVELIPAICYKCGRDYWAFPGVPTHSISEQSLWDGVRAGTIKTSMRVQTCKSKECEAHEQRRQDAEFNEIHRIKNKVRNEEKANAPSTLSRPKKGGRGNASDPSLRQTPASMQPLLSNDEGHD